MLEALRTFNAGSLKIMAQARDVWRSLGAFGGDWMWFSGDDSLGMLVTSMG